MEVQNRMGKLSDELLVKSYFKSKDLKLNPEFVQLLEDEIRRRFLGIKTNIPA